MTNMLHRVLWGRGYAEPQQIPLAIAGEEAEVMAVSGGGHASSCQQGTWMSDAMMAVVQCPSACASMAAVQYLQACARWQQYKTLWRVPRWQQYNILRRVP